MASPISKEVGLVQWFSSGGHCASSPKRLWAMAGDIFSCHTGGIVTGIWWVEARNATKHLTVHRMGPTTESDAQPDVKSTEAAQAGIAQLVGASSHNQNVAGSIPGQGRLRVHPQSGHEHV